MSSRRVRVDLLPKTSLDRSYDILIEDRLFSRSRIELSPPFSSDTRFFVITDQNVAKAGYLEKLKKLIRVGGTFSVQPGEPSKSLGEVENLLQWLAREKANRADALLALGGGVIGDLAGFVASIYLRGLPWLQVPTTLLAMVDSSVGGKTGVNMREGKNLVGTFHQPKMVWIDLGSLDSLPQREFASGMAEVIKYGLIQDAALFARGTQMVRPTDPDMGEIIARCLEIKARIVAEDEFETKEVRALLNFGHTLGHALEKTSNYTGYLHGEAIAVGMRAAALLSQKAGLVLRNDEINLLVQALQNNGLPTHITADLAAQCSSQALTAALSHDKKVAADGRNRWVLLETIGKSRSGMEVTPEQLEEVIAELYHPFTPLPDLSPKSEREESPLSSRSPYHLFPSLPKP